MATKLYLREESTEATASGVSGSLSAALAAPDVAASRFRDLSETIAPGSPTTARQSPTLNSLAQTALQRMLFGVWVSPTLGGTDISAQTWTIAHVGREGNANSNMFPVVVLYVLKDDGTVRGFIYDVDAAQGGVELPVSSPPPANVYTLSGSAVTGVTATDRLVAEFWTRGSQATATSYITRGVNYGGTVEPLDGVADATNDEATYIETPQDALFDVVEPPDPGGLTTKLYFRNTQTQTLGFVTTEKSSAMTAAASRNQARDLLSPISAGPKVNSAVDTVAGLATPHRLYHGKWISEPLSGISTLDAGDWEFFAVGNMDTANGDYQLMCSIYVLKDDDTVRGYVYDNGAPLSNLLTTSTRGREWVVAGASVGSIATDDRICIEIWSLVDNTGPAVGTPTRFQYDGTTEPVEGVNNTDAASYVMVPQAGLFGTSTDLDVDGTLGFSGDLTISALADNDITVGGTLGFSGDLTMAVLLEQSIVADGVLGFDGDLRIRKLADDVCQVSETQWWLRHCGLEVSNLARTWEYLRLYRPRDLEIICEPDSVLYRTTGEEEEFIHPAYDPAPWYDPARPESAEFLGFAGMPTVGPAQGRSVTRRASGGASLGPLRQTEREIVVPGFLFAVTGRGLDYGLRWLTDMLAGCADCEDCESEVMLAAPWSDGLDDTVGRYRLYETALADPGVETGERYCEQVMAVSFTLVSGNGYLFRDPDLLVPLEALPGVTSGVCVPFSQWICEAPEESVQALVAPPPSGEIGTIITIDATGGFVNGVRIEIAADCDDPDPLVSLRTQSLPQGSVLTIDSGRELITYTSPEGDVLDGSSYIILTDDQTIPWAVLSACEGARCVRVRRDRFCSGSADVRVAIQTQEKHR